MSTTRDVLFDRGGIVRTRIDTSWSEDLYRVSLHGRRLGLLLHTGSRVLGAKNAWYWKRTAAGQWRKAKNRNDAVKHLLTSTRSR